MKNPRIPFRTQKSEVRIDIKNMEVSTTAVTPKRDGNYPAAKLHSHLPAGEGQLSSGLWPLLVLFVSLAACQPESPQTVTDATKKTDSAASNLVSLTSEQYQTVGIELGNTEQRTISGTLKVNGLLDAPPQNLVSISPPMGGFLKSTPLLQGMPVKKGQVIAVIENLDFIQLQQDYLDSKSQLDFLEAEYQRQQELNKENVNAVKTLQQARAQYQSMLAKVQGLQAKLRFINLNPAKIGQGNIQPAIQLYSPITGFVTQVHGNLGSYINATSVLFQIVDPEHLHAELTIFEKDISQIKVGQKVRFTLANETRERTATVYLIRKEIEADRSVGVHCHLDQEDNNLLPGTYLTAWIETGNEAVPTLPESAIINAGDKKYIFVQKAKTDKGADFEQIAVQTGNIENGFVEIVSFGKSKPAHPIVLKGAYDLWATMTNTEEE